MGTGEDTLPSESVLSVAGSSSKFLVVFGSIMIFDGEGLSDFRPDFKQRCYKPHQKRWDHIFTFRKFKQNLQVMRTNILPYH